MIGSNTARVGVHVCTSGVERWGREDDNVLSPVFRHALDVALWTSQVTFDTLLMLRYGLSQAIFDALLMLLHGLSQETSHTLLMLRYGLSQETSDTLLMLHYGLLK